MPTWGWSDDLAYAAERHQREALRAAKKLGAWERMKRDFAKARSPVPTRGNPA